MKNLSSILDEKKISGGARIRIIFHVFIIQISLDDYFNSFKIEHENITLKMYPIFEYHLTYSVKNEFGERIKKTIIEEIRIK